jgi:hypothetical protein
VCVSRAATWTQCVDSPSRVAADSASDSLNFPGRERRRLAGLQPVHFSAYRVPQERRLRLASPELARLGWDIPKSRKRGRKSVNLHKYPTLHAESAYTALACVNPTWFARFSVFGAHWPRDESLAPRRALPPPLGTSSFSR